MKNNMGEESEALSQKIVQKIKPVYSRYRNIVAEQFRNKFNGLKIDLVYKKIKENKNFAYCVEYRDKLFKQIRDKFSGIEIDLIYKKLRESKIFTCYIEHKDKLFKQIRDRAGGIEIGSIYKKFKENKGFIYCNKYKDIIAGQFRNILDGIKTSPVYEKFRESKVFVYCNKCKDIIAGRFRNVFDGIKTNPVWEKFRENRKLIYKIAGGAAISLILATFTFLKINDSYIAYSVGVNDNILAVVRNESDFIDALEGVKEEVSSLYGQEVVLDKEPIFIQTKAKKGEITQHEEMIKNIKAQFDIKLKAVAIKIDGERVIIVKDDKAAHRILENIKNSFVGESESEYDYVGFVEKVEVMEIAVDFSDIMDEEEALQLIAIGTDEERVHEIEKGENTWTIALKYGLEMDDIMKANPGIEPRKLQIGQKISLIVPKPLVSVKTKEYIELVEEIPFETEYEETDALYKGDKKIIVHGEEGKREIKGYSVKENGVETDREIMEEKILSKPKTRVIAEGTKARPATMATGFFSNPTRGRLTSSFGMRWGRAHTGIDIASSRGTSIFAADAGKVSFSGWKGSYGNLVIIDHENGYQTYYAHNNRNLVKQGERVYKGQKIAEMGSTGRSTGVHLHFEVRKNGTPVNPQNFVRY